MKPTDKGYGLVSIDKSNQNLFTDRDLNNNVYKKCRWIQIKMSIYHRVSGSKYALYTKNSQM